jgi:tRNA (adenine37-N6)-methyltransferase
MTPDVYQVRPIGFLHCGFVEKFGIPRQPGLAPSIKGAIVMQPEFCHESAFAGLETATHIWVQFIFHEHVNKWHLQVRPPRLGGNQKLGVFASRSSFRPNALGMSVLQFLGLEWQSNRLCLKVAGIDMLHRTPILDIKPYVPYADAIPHAHFALAASPPVTYDIKWQPQPEAFCQQFILDMKNSQIKEDFDDQNWGFELGFDPSNLKQCINELLRQDPRPQYHSIEQNRLYGMRLFNLDVLWCYGQSDTADNAPFWIEVRQLSYVAR